MDKQEYGGGYLYAEDLIRGGDYVDATVTIEKVIPPNTITTQGKKLIPHYTLQFAGKEKLFVLCAKVNQRLLPIVTGEAQPEKWVGHKITLQVRIVEAFGSQVPALRIVPPAGTLIRKSLKDRMGKKASLKNA